MGSSFLATWSQLGSNLAAKTFPKSIQVGPKIHKNSDQDADNFFASFFIALGTLLCQFSVEVVRPRNPKVLKKTYVKGTTLHNPFKRLVSEGINNENMVCES